MVNYIDILNDSFSDFYNLKGQTFDIINVSKPDNLEYAEQLVKYISKLSPFVGNMLEFAVVESLNENNNYKHLGSWIRQDPDFPDTLFKSDSIIPNPGIEIKAWFPLATEITARFKETINSFDCNSTYVALIAWLPEFLFFGKPKIIDVWIGPASSLAEARDSHYHNPPDYIVIEPENTASRTRNLQQRNVNGYKFQGNAKKLEEALIFMNNWQTYENSYSSSREYQDLLKTLMSNFTYRNDTNFAKIDRINHPEIEIFKTKILNTKIHDHTISEWAKIIDSDSNKLDDFLKNII